MRGPMLTCAKRGRGWVDFSAYVSIAQLHAAAGIDTPLRYWVKSVRRAYPNVLAVGLGGSDELIDCDSAALLLALDGTPEAHNALIRFSSRRAACQDLIYRLRIAGSWQSLKSLPFATLVIPSSLEDEAIRQLSLHKMTEHHAFTAAIRQFSAEQRRPAKSEMH